jgi:hypothetical protein
VALSLSDTELSYETFRGAELFGVGLGLRVDLAPHWQLELAADVLGSDEDGVEQMAVPLSAGVVASLFPEGIFDPYATAGLGLMVSQVDEAERGDTEHYAQVEGYLGGGLALHLGDFLVTSDLRLVALSARPDRSPPEAAYVPVDTGDDVTVRGGAPGTTLLAPADGDDVNVGVQFLLGVGLEF